MGGPAADEYSLNKGEKGSLSIETKNKLSVMDKTGDTKTTWDPANPVEVEIAKKTFDEFRKKGFLAFKVNVDGKKGEQLHEFDPNARAIILTPPLAGG